MMTPEELNKLDSKELERELRKAHRELLKLRLQKASNELKETHKIQNHRKYLAHLKTRQGIINHQPTIA